MVGKKILFFAFLVFLGSCKGIKETKLSPNLKRHNCQQEAKYLQSQYLSQNAFEAIPWDSLLGSGFSENSIRVAYAIGLTDLLLDYQNALKRHQDQPTLEAKVTHLELLQDINNKLNLASLEISSIFAELDCEEEKAEQIANFLRKKEEDLNTKLTVGSIVTGALGAILTSALVLNDREVSGERVAIGTAVLGAVIGFSILGNKRKVSLRHNRNPLKDIWFGGDISEIYPPSLWFYLNFEKNLNGSTTSPRLEIKASWEAADEVSEMKEEEKEKYIRLFFGEGGKYTAEMLFQRAEMLDQVESQINWMKEDLRDLSLEIMRLKQNMLP